MSGGDGHPPPAPGSAREEPFSPVLLGNPRESGQVPRTTAAGRIDASRRDRNEWTLYLDQYASRGGYMPVTTTNPSAVGTYQLPASGSYNLGGTKKRHGSILPLTAAEETRVLARWASTPAKRLQSFNFQDRYVRHANFDVRIAQNVTAPTPSSGRSPAWPAPAPSPSNR